MDGLLMIIVIAVVLIGGGLYMKMRNRGFGGGRKKCGYCRAWVKYSAPYCPKCGYEFIQF